MARKQANLIKWSPAAKEVCAIFILRANKNKLEVLGREPITSGSVNVYMARFEFSPDWQGLTRKAVFKAGKESRAVLLGESGQCVIPWEVLTSHGQPLMAGVFGTADETALPTTWASLGTILEGVPGDGEGSKPPTPDLWEQELDRKGDTLAYDGLNLSLKSGEKTLSSVEIAGGGGRPAYRFGHGLKQDGLEVSVDAVSDFSGDNTLPMTAAGVQTTVGNIEALLATI